jgi:hypothetical protein
MKSSAPSSSPARGRMRSSAVFVNPPRGTILDERALAVALVDPLRAVLLTATVAERRQETVNVALKSRVFGRMRKVSSMFFVSW